MLTGYSFFKIFTAFRLHFNSKYDVIKYGGKVPHIAESFSKNPRKIIFEQWGNRLKNPTHASEMCLGNFITNADRWVYEDPSDANGNYDKWKEIQSDLPSFLAMDAEYIATILHEKGITYDELIGKNSSGNKPTLLQMFLARRVIPETILILDSTSDRFLPQWVEQYSNDPLVSSQLFRLDKYKSFASISKINQPSSFFNFTNT